ncbi:hypothetical protein CKY10_09680 [Photorhabdus sp. HUG-39]|uniref:Uncharacterized protein n=1 Tax=Photorhabdus kayaii TaxID=230088 RepID=A0ABX0B4Q4_9GAMM|nr:MULTISPECIES: hypothetical protein [Photorhabdus]MCC8375203.1 hypothetical protein [Photorhabdus bodei]NDL11908.1 hypothetical protein [Photorhabdus kayaii]NDL25542.1 hypothetical protein [Photorhabdus kayaii]RAX09932.1 hypothetical protein CKY10_09680 [Photorhabdus sp. HUG-39]
MMTDKEISTVDSLKASFKSGVRLMPEAFSHLIDEAYKVYEIIDGAQGNGPTTGLKRDGKGKLTLNTRHSGGLNLEQGALALSLKPGGLSFDRGGYLKLDADRQIQFADFFSLSRRERMEITQVLGLKRTMITRIVSPFPKEKEYFGSSISLNAAGDCLAVGMINKVYVYTRRKSGEWNISKPIVFEAYEDEYHRSSWDVSLDAAGDTLALGNMLPYPTYNRGRVCVYTRTKGVWDTKHPVVFPIVGEYFGVNVSLSGAGDCLVGGARYYSPFRIFMRRNGIWDTENPIKLPLPPNFYEFGWIAHLSAAGNCLAVHCHDSSSGPTISTIFVYTRTNGIWDGENPIKFSHPEGESSSFSQTFSLNAEGDCLVVGTEFYKSTDGEVYLYTRTNGIWDRENPIKFSAPASGVYFGSSLELNDAGDRLAVGASYRVYLYTCLNNKWNMETPMEILNPSGNSDNLNGFGGSVGLNKAGTSLAVGATIENVDSKSKAGAVYVFENVKIIS